jgi:hypothetical protein
MALGSNFTISNYYCNISQYNQEMLVDGVLYAYAIGSSLYLLTTTGVFRYIWNKDASASDYGVWNRDVSYITYEIPFSQYGPCVLGDTLGFINRNGMFCLLSMASGEIKRIQSWNFPVDGSSPLEQIWGFISELGNSCFVVGNTVVDTTYRGQDNIVLCKTSICLCGYAQFSVKENNAEKFELVLLAARPQSSSSNNFSDGFLSFASFEADVGAYASQYYVRRVTGAGKHDRQMIEKDEAISLLQKNLGVIVDEKKGSISFPQKNVFTVNANSDAGSDFQHPEFLMLGALQVGVNMPIVVNKIPLVVSIPKVSIGFSGLFFSDLVSYLGIRQDRQRPVSRLLATLLINGQKFTHNVSDSTQYSNGEVFSKFIEFVTGNNTASHCKIDVSLEQTVEVEDNFVNVAIVDSFYMNPVQLVYAPAVN